MRKVTIAMVFAVLAASSATSTSVHAGRPEKSKAGPWQIAVTADRADGVYNTGQPITFTIELTQDGKAADGKSVSYEIEVDGSRCISQGTVDVADGKATVTARLSKPGCLMILVRYEIEPGRKITDETGAAVAWQKLQPSLPAPDDFDAFWTEQKKRLADVPMNPRLTPVAAPGKSMKDRIECFDVQLDCPGGAPVSGHFARPRGAKPKSLAAVISFHGAGVHGARLSGPIGQALRGRLGMDINAHGSPNRKPPEFYRQLLTGDLRNYPHRGMDSRDTYYMLGMYLRVARALEFLTSQPEWNGKVLVATGSSQGGAQAIVAAGLDSRVTIVSASLPALCDLGGPAADRAAGWPVGRGKLTDAKRRTLRYFDVCHFAARTKATAVVRVGLVDRTCWPAGVLSMCNQFKGTRHVLIHPASGHAYSRPQTYREASKKLEQVIAAATTKANEKATP
jgi:cephalosporin-C deacetylase